jgi:hypothetical protein
MKGLEYKRILMRDGQGRYECGQLRCSVCSIFIFTNHVEGNLCPCCKTKLRTRPKGMKFKRKFRSRISSPLSNEKGIHNFSLSKIIHFY